VLDEQQEQNEIKEIHDQPEQQEQNEIKEIRDQDEQHELME
jgi:hypothetical protein